MDKKRVNRLYGILKLIDRDAYAEAIIALQKEIMPVNHNSSQSEQRVVLRANSFINGAIQNLQKTLNPPQVNVLTPSGVEEWGDFQKEKEEIKELAELCVRTVIQGPRDQAAIEMEERLYKRFRDSQQEFVRDVLEAILKENLYAHSQHRSDLPNPEYRKPRGAKQTAIFFIKEQYQAHADYRELSQMKSGMNVFKELKTRLWNSFKSEYPGLAVKITPETFKDSYIHEAMKSYRKTDS